MKGGLKLSRFRHTAKVMRLTLRLTLRHICKYGYFLLP